MRVELRRDGGFAAPALSRPVVVETDGLTERDAAAVEGAVQAARSCLVGRPSVESAPPLGADLIRYTVVVAGERGVTGSTDSGPSEELTFSDPIPDPALAALVDAILELGEVQQR